MFHAEKINARRILLQELTGEVRSFILDLPEYARERLITKMEGWEENDVKKWIIDTNKISDHNTLKKNVEFLIGSIEVKSHQEKAKGLFSSFFKGAAPNKGFWDGFNKGRELAKKFKERRKKNERRTRKGEEQDSCCKENEAYDDEHAHLTFIIHYSSLSGRYRI